MQTDDRHDLAPKVSILMGIYNCADTLPAAVQSILDQVDVGLELILCDDGSTDETHAVAADLTQKHDGVTLLRNPKNLGLAPTLNHCRAAARGEYLARMDGDDVCAPDRLVRQIAVLDSESDVAFVGTAAQFFDEDVWAVVETPAHPDAKTLARGNPFVHGSIVMRRQAFDAVGGYSEKDRHWRVEDYDLWVRMYRAGYRGVALPEPLYGLRNDLAAMSRRSWRARRNEAWAILACVRSLGLPPIHYLSALRPLVLGLMPLAVYSKLYRHRHVGRVIESSVGWASPAGWVEKIPRPRND